MNDRFMQPRKAVFLLCRLDLIPSRRPCLDTRVCDEHIGLCEWGGGDGGCMGIMTGLDLGHAPKIEREPDGAESYPFSQGKHCIYSCEVLHLVYVLKLILYFLVVRSTITLNSQIRLVRFCRAADANQRVRKLHRDVCVSGAG